MNKFKMMTMVAAIIASYPFSSVSTQGQTQQEKNEQAAASTDKAESRLNQSFRDVIAKFPSNQIFISKLKTSQAAWIGYRDAHLKSIFPADKPLEVYGESYTSCYQTELLSQIQHRIDRLMSISNLCNADVSAAKHDYELKEADLNVAYSKASARVKSTDLRYLQSAQTEWLNFRDAEADAQAMLGNAKNREAMILKTRSTLDAARTVELNAWAVGYKGNNACCGSRPIN